MKAPSNPSERQPSLSLLSSPRIFIWIDHLCSPLFGKCLSSFYFRTLSYFLVLICILSLYRTPVLHPVTKLKPPPSRFLCDERASEFQFPTSSVTLELSYFSFFNSFSPPLFQRLASSLFFFLAFSHISYISCISPFSFIGPRSSRLPRVLYFSHIVRR